MKFRQPVEIHYSSGRTASFWFFPYWLTRDVYIVVLCYQQNPTGPNYWVPFKYPKSWILI